MKISIVVATSQNNVIGKDGKIPWRIPQELSHFKRTTLGHHVLMGRKTHESIGKPLSGRINLVLSRNQSYSSEGCLIFGDLSEAIEFAKHQGEEELMVIGGEQVYRLTIPLAERIYQSIILQDFEGDALFPEINPEQWRELAMELHDRANIPFKIRSLERKG